MPSDFDKYLDQLSDQDKAALDNVKEQVQAENVPDDKSPGDQQQDSWTPDPKDAGKQDKEGQDMTVKEAGQTLQDHGTESAPENGTLTAQYPPSPANDNQKDQQQQLDNDLDR